MNDDISRVAGHTHLSWPLFSRFWPAISALSLSLAGGACSSAVDSVPRRSDSPAAISSTGPAPAHAGVGSVAAPMPAASPSVPTVAPSAMGPGPMMSPSFDRESSVAAFERTLYPVLREHCAACHSEPPEGTGQLPLHASADVNTAHEHALARTNLRQVATSKLVERQGVEGHHCWSDCVQDGNVMRMQAQAWADAVRDTLPESTLPRFEGEVSEAQVLQWIDADRANVSPADSQYLVYSSLHRLHNMQASPDDMNTARAGLSKILNSTSMYGPKIVNPVAIDPYYLVYRFDIRDYWGYRAAGQPDPARALDTWKRVQQGNFNADDQDPGPNTFGNRDTPMDSLARDTSTFPNIAGFFPDYVDATQLGYSLSRPDVYADVMRLGTNSALLERQLGVVSTGVDSWKFVTVNDAITINHRMLLRSTTPTGFFWKGVDPFAQAPFIFYDRPVPEMDGFSLVKTTPVFDDEGRYAYDHQITEDANGNLVGGPQAQASEMIFSLPNGLQAYFVGGAANQIRVDAFQFIVFDPRRSGLPSRGGFFGAPPDPRSALRLLGPASCMSCHVDGMNRLNDDMIPYIEAHPDKFDAATVARVRQLYPGTEEMRRLVEADREIFADARTTIRQEMIVGISDKTLYVEPIYYLFESAQRIFNYTPTASN